MNSILLSVVLAIYTYVGARNAWSGNLAGTLIFTGYAIAQVGIIIFERDQQ